MYENEYLEARNLFIIEELNNLEKSQIIDMIIKYSSFSYLESLTTALKIHSKEVKKDV